MPGREASSDVTSHDAVKSLYISVPDLDYFHASSGTHFFQTYRAFVLLMFH